jgi:hypothetical protein
VLIRNARVWPSGAHLAGEGALAEIPRADVRMEAGVIAECGPCLRPVPGEEVIDAATCVRWPPRRAASLSARREPGRRPTLPRG